MKKILSLLLILYMLIPCLAACGVGGKLEKQYKEAIGFIEEKNYESAYEIFLTLGDYKDTERYLSSFHFLPTNKVVKDFGGEHVTKLVFDEDGRPKKILEDDYCVLELSYDSNGNVVNSVYRGTNAEYTYDQNGNLITETYSNSDGTDSYKYVYDEAGRVIEEIIDSFDGSTNSTETIKYTYDSRGELVKKECSSGTDKKVVIHTTDITYNDNDKPVRKAYKQETDGKISGESLTEYSYDADGRLIRESEEETQYAYLFQDYHPLRAIDTTTDYLYDDNGNLLTMTSVSKREGKKTNEVKIEYTYDDAGNLIKESKRDECPGGTFVEMGFELQLASWLYIDETYYGENGNITRRTRYRDFDDVTIEQRFDDYGNMVHQKNDHKDSDLMRSEIEITYVLVYIPDMSTELLDEIEGEMLMYTWRIEE